MGCRCQRPCGVTFPVLTNCSAQRRFRPPAQEVMTSAIPHDSSVNVDFLQSGKNMSPNFCISKTPIINDIKEGQTNSNNSSLGIIPPFQTIDKSGGSSNNILQGSTKTNP